MTRTLAKRISTNPLVVRELSLKETVCVIEYLNIEYYNNYESHVSDESYDALKDHLQTFDPSHKLLSLIDAPMMSRKKVRLPFHMGSMDKIKPSDGVKKLQSWVERNGDADLVWSMKLDGISGALVIDTSLQRYRLYTRGSEGRYGLEVTALAKFIRLPDPKHMDPTLCLRGEFIISKKAFNKYKAKHPETKNVRNLVGGVINSKQPNPEVAKLIRFVIYEVIGGGRRFTEQMEMVRSLGFDCVEFGTVNILSFETLSKILVKERVRSVYGMDGIIITHNHTYIRNTTKNPEYAFAFKDVLDDQKAIATILDVEWNVSKDNYLKPKLIVSPTQVGEVVVRCVTAHNAKYVVEHQLGKGSVIEIIRSGDVIPKVHRVVEPAKPPYLPKHIPYEWNTTNVDIIAIGKSIDLVVKQIHYFFSKLNVPNFGEATVRRIVLHNNNTSIRSIINLGYDDLLEIEGFSNKKANIVVDGIGRGIETADLVAMMVGSNVFGRSLGSTKLRLIVEAEPDTMSRILRIKHAEIEALNRRIVGMKGFDTKSADLFTENIERFQEFMNQTFDSGVLCRLFASMKKEKKKTRGTSGQIVVCSGFRDKEFEAWIVEQGGEVRSTISKKTTLLVVSDLDVTKSSKIRKAIELGIEIRSRDSFIF